MNSFYSILTEIHDDHKFLIHLIKSSFENDKIDESSYQHMLGEILETDNNDLDKLLEINKELINALEDRRKMKISERLIIGAEKIEATTDPKEKARLMNHYNNLLKELSA